MLSLFPTFVSLNPRPTFYWITLFIIVSTRWKFFPTNNDVLRKRFQPLTWRYYHHSSFVSSPPTLCLLLLQWSIWRQMWMGPTSTSTLDAATFSISLDQNSNRSKSLATPEEIFTLIWHPKYVQLLMLPISHFWTRFVFVNIMLSFNELILHSDVNLDTGCNLVLYLDIFDALSCYVFCVPTP